MHLSHLDHLVLTVNDIATSVSFYQRVLNMQKVSFGQNRTALTFGQQKINLHEKGKEFEPKAYRPTTGSADLCFISATPMEKIVDHLHSCNITILEGPILRTGATGPILSVYIRDPDQNLIEIANLQ